VLKGCLGTAPWCLGGPFIAPRDLGAIEALFGSPWLPSVRGCTRLFGAHWTLHNAMVNGSLIGHFLFSGGRWSVQWGTGCPVHLLTVGYG
jgi:quinol-cytochrome oxidoreductase complex cytochrome b subunit